MSDGNIYACNVWDESNNPVPKLCGYTENRLLMQRYITQLKQLKESSDRNFTWHSEECPLNMNTPVEYGLDEYQDELVTSVSEDGTVAFVSTRSFVEYIVAQLDVIWGQFVADFTKTLYQFIAMVDIFDNEYQNTIEKFILYLLHIIIELDRTREGTDAVRLVSFLWGWSNL